MTFFFITLSALSLSFSLLYGCWYLAFLWLVPIFFYSYHNRLFWYHGLLWGVIFYSTHAIGLLHCIITLGHGPLRFIAAGCFVVLGGAWAAVWFYLLSYNAKSSFIIDLFSTVFYFWVVDNYFFVLIGQVRGYPFSFPLIPLVTQPELLSVLSCSNQWLLVGAIIGFQLSLVQTYYRRGRYYLVSLLFISPFIYGCFYPREKKTDPDWLNTIAYCSVPSQYKTPYDAAYTIVERLQIIKHRYPEVKVILLPETAFPYPLNEFQWAIDLWTDVVLKDDMFLILGAQIKKDENSFNAFIILNKGRIILAYEKQDLIPFFERRVNGPFLTEYMDSLFLYKKVPFTSGASERPVIDCADLKGFLPIICSELFWMFPKKEKSNLLIALMRTGRFNVFRYNELIVSTARLLSIKNSMNFLYISSETGLWVSHSGAKLALKTVLF